MTTSLNDEVISTGLISAGENDEVISPRLPVAPSTSELAI
jgi:hypothetical protein